MLALTNRVELTLDEFEVFLKWLHTKCVARFADFIHLRFASWF